jgi:hypothetical protein
LVKTHINVGVKLSSEQCPKTEEEVEYMSHVLIQVFLKFLCMPLSILDRTLPMHHLRDLNHLRDLSTNCWIVVDIVELNT